MQLFVSILNTLSMQCVQDYRIGSRRCPVFEQFFATFHFVHVLLRGETVLHSNFHRLIGVLHSCNVRCRYIRLIYSIF
jgi:hypothetical protein